MQRHNYHLVTESPWPLFASIAALFLPINAVLYFHAYEGALLLLFISLALVLFFMGIWWRDVIREGTYLGDHTKIVQKGLRYGMVLFIVSEIMFFFSFFWAFLYCAWIPSVELGGIWPPLGVTPPSPWGVPLLNTVTLLWSGVTITWAHHALMAGQKYETRVAHFCTILLAGFFTGLQFVEYKHATFTIADGVYGSTFYMTTGFHGLHVIIGTIFITVCYYRVTNDHFTRIHHLGFEFAAWYWHFVDVVWLLLFLIFYIWGSMDRIYNMHDNFDVLISFFNNNSGQVWYITKIYE